MGNCCSEPSSVQPPAQQAPPPAQQAPPPPQKPTQAPPSNAHHVQIGNV